MVLFDILGIDPISVL